MKQSSVLRRAPVFAAVLVSVGLASHVAGQGPITPNNVVVVRIGDGSAALTNGANPAFLEEFTTAGTPVQTIPLPTVVNGAHKRLTNSGTATSEGILNLSADRRYLLLAGYDAAVGTPAVAATSTSGTTPVLRVVGRVDLNQNIDTTTALTTYSGTNLRSATSNTGTDFWVAGPTNGVGYVASLGASTSTQLCTTPNNIRVVRIVGGQLYVSSASSQFQGVSLVGSGLPTTAGQIITLLPGFPTATGPQSYDFFFADPSTLYVADDRASAAGGIQKWTFGAGTWTLQYTLNPSASVGCRGLTGIVSGGVAVLYATTAEATGNRVVTVTDVGPGSAFTTLATAAPNTIFRGLRYILTPPAVTSVGSGCPGTGSLTPVLSSTQVPSLNNLGFTVDVTQGAPNSAAYLFAAIGTDPVGLPLGGGCTIHLDYPTLLLLISIGFTPTGPVITGPTGDATIPFPIYNLPPLSGVHVGLQAAVIDGASPIGLTLTNALDLLIY